MAEHHLLLPVFRFRAYCVFLGVFEEAPVLTNHCAAPREHRKVSAHMGASTEGAAAHVKLQRMIFGEPARLVQ